MNNAKINQLRWLWLSIAVLIADQWMKNWIVTQLRPFTSKKLAPFLNFTLKFNTGAAFSFLGDSTGWQRWLFVAIAIAVSGGILVWLSRFPRNENWMACALALVLGGALGNLWDRLALGYVIDYVDFHVGSWHFATFNLADSAISIGIFMWLFGVCFFKGKRW